MTTARPALSAHPLLLARFVVVSILLLLALVVPPSASAGGTLNLELVKSGLSSPMFVTHAFDDRLFVVERAGVVKIIHSNNNVSTFMDISSKVRTDGERGLLSMAFHPSYGSNRLFYVFYTRVEDGDLIIAEYKRNATDPNQANEGSERILLRIEHSSRSNHNGGWMAFKGNHLYISTGDGAADPSDAQDKNTLLGKILRINPLDPPGSADYSVPSSNPYVGRNGRNEVFSRGLRNPWRCSHDSETGRLWCNDVGESRWEEINRVKTGNGVNFGWPTLEGRHPRGTSDPCTSNCKTLPIAEYSHSFNESTGGGFGCTSTTGGYVSRRAGAPLYGQYVFGDYCSGLMWMIPANFDSGSALPAPVDTNHNIVSFGEGNDKKLYMVDIGGSIYRLTDS